MDAFKKKYRTTSILLYIAFFMCVFGYYGICFISVKFFEEVEGGAVEGVEGWKQNKTYWEALISASSEIPALFVGVYLLDRIGRKGTLLLSFGIFTASSFLLIFPFFQGSTVLGVLCVLIARMNISLGFMSIYIYFSEYYPTAIRSTALGMASAAGRIAGMLTSIVSEDTPFTIGILMYAISGGIAFLCTLGVGETMGRSMATSVVEQPEWLRDNVVQSVDVDVDENGDHNFEMQLSKKHFDERNNKYDKLTANSTQTQSQSTSDDLN